MSERCLHQWVLLSGVLWLMGYVQPISAQVVPDTTLPAGERSQAIGNLNIQVDGGAVRGRNLFHSFSQFSIPTSGSAYFNNAVEIQNIFTRVTGQSISNIDGVIRANGTANLFLLNPNGILFGPNARLNIGGSFLASTDDRFQFADGSEFSAVNLQAPPLLAVNVTLGLQYGRNLPNATIINQGNLAVAQDLTLSADRLELQGQLQAGRDLSLLAENIVQVRDSAIAPFLAQAGRNLTIQGNQGIDILALHPSSQPAFVSGSNLSLISDGVISGDAQFASGSHFVLKSVSGGLADFVSLYDPIISAKGDVDLAANYTGASLLVEAQGSIRFQGNITITGPDTRALPAGPDTETLRTSSALILRSGQGALVYGDKNSGATPTSSNANVSTPGITLGGNVVLQPFNGAGGIVNLITGVGNVSTQAVTTNGGTIRVTSAGAVTTNQKPLSTSNGANNGGSITAIANGDISTGAITSLSSSQQGNSGNGGDLTLNTTKGTISTDLIRTGSFSSLSSGRGGDVTINTANGNISGFFTLTTTSSGSGNAGKGGNITLSAANGNIIPGRLYTSSSSNSGVAGDGGRVAVSTTNGNIKVDRLISTSSTVSGSASNGGAIALSVTNGNIIASSINSGAPNPAGITSSGVAGNGGTITLNAVNGNISTDRLVSSVIAPSNAGDGGAITLVAPNGSILTTGYLSSGSFSTVGRGGRGGHITLIAAGTIQPYDPNFSVRNFTTLSTINTAGVLGSGNITIETQSPFALSNFLISSDTFGAGRGGDIQITAPSIALTNGSQISASTHSSGQGGNITLRASDSIQLSGATTQNLFGTLLRSGFAGLPPGTYVGGYIPTGANPSATENFQLPAGTVFPTGAFTQTTAGTTGSAGNLSLETGQLIIQDRATLATTTFGQNSNAGSISIRAREAVSLVNGNILSGVAGGAIGNSGEINVTTPSLTVTDGIIQTQTLGQGRAGDVQITVPNQVNLSGISSGVRSGSGGNNTLLGATGSNSGQGGNIRVTTGTLNITNGAALNAQTQTNSRGGDIRVDADRLNLVTGGQLLTATSGSGQAGDITVKAPDLQLLGSASGFFSGTTSAGDAGNLTIQPRGNGQTVRVNLRDGAQISASTASRGRGGDLTIVAPESITLTGDGSIIAAGTGGSGAGGNLNLRTGTLNIQNRAEVTVSSLSTGLAGSLFVNADRIFLNHQGSIRADTSGGGGNINLQSPFIILRNGSNITTNATGSNILGGNIAINTQFLVAVPREDSNISANSENFRGGNVSINAFSIYGIQPRPNATPLSDITATGATSALGGTIDVTTAGIDPTSGLVELPIDLVDSALIAQGCPANQGNSFVISGRGGLPPTPEQQLDDDAEWSDRRRLTVAQQTSQGRERTENREPRTDTPIIEATGWQITPAGVVFLVATTPAPTVQNRLNQSVACQGR